MKVIIAGSRSITDYMRVTAAILASGWADQITEVVSGRAIGVDRLGEQWAKKRGISIKYFEVTAEDWKHLGRGAGCVRNREMAQYADALILVWDKRSKGSVSMWQEAKLAGLRIFALCPECWRFPPQDCPWCRDLKGPAHLEGPIRKTRQVREEI